MRKGQVSFYVIVGVILVVIIGSFLMLKYASVKKDIKTEANEKAELSMSRENIKSMADDCLEKSTLKAIDNFGLIDSEKDIADYIEIDILRCLGNFKTLKDNGYDVVYEKPDARVSVNEDILSVDLIFKIELSRGKEKINFIN